MQNKESVKPTGSYLKIKQDKIKSLMQANQKKKKIRGGSEEIPSNTYNILKITREDLGNFKTQEKGG